MLRTDPGLILTALLTVLFLSTQASAAYGFYTIQTGTYDYRPYAVEQLSFIRDNLKGHDLTYLRVVEFRKLFAVRAGRFSDRAAANRYLSPLRTLYPDAFILSVKHERVSYALKDPTPAPPPRKEDIPGKDPATIHEKAKELSRRGEYRRALSLLSPFVSDPMRYPAIVSDYIVLLIWEGREGKAIRLYESLPPPFPRRIYLLENMGRAYYDEGAFKDASRLYQAALAQDPSDLEARKGIIYSAIKMGKWPLAAKHLEVLLTRHPSPVSAASEVAGVLLSSGLYGETLDLYRIIDKRGDATGEEGFRARDNLLASLPEATRETMITALLEKAKDEGRDAVADYILLLILNREYEKAVAYLEERELDPSSLADNMTAQIAWAYFKTGDTERAKEYYRDILSSRPDYLRAELGLAYCFAVEGNDDGAMEILDRLAATEPGSVEVRFARAFAHERTGRLWETIKEYDHITTLSPDDPTARRLKLQAMSDLGMTTQAIEAASRELPHDRDLIDNLRGDQAIDHLYWDETDKALDILRALMKDEDNMRARFDTIAALIRNGNGEEALEEYEELLDEGITVPSWLLGSIAELYRARGEPSMALPLYERLRAEHPGSFRAGMDMFHTLQELRRWEEAEEILDALERGQPDVFIEGDRVRPNWDRLEVAVARGWFLANQDRLSEGEKHFMELRERAPANSGICSGLAHIYLWRGWHHRALREFRVIESRDPGNVGILTGKIAALNEVGLKSEAREAAASLLSRHPGNRHIQNLIRRFEVEETGEGNLSLVYTWDEDGTKEVRAETTLSHPLSLKTRLYGFLLWQKTWDDTLESYFRRAGLGVTHHLATSWMVRQHFAINTEDGEDFGSFTLADFHPNDYWRFEISFDSFTTDVPMRARIFDIDADKTVFGATYRESDWRSYTLSLSTMSFSDGNRRDAALIGYEQGLWAKGDWMMRLMLDLYSSRNSLDDAPYFNPEEDYSLSVTHRTEHTLRRSRNSSHLQRFYLTLGGYKQSGFSNGLTGAVEYEHEYTFSDVHALLLGAAVARNVYDGEGVNSYTLSLNYTGRF